MTNAYHRTFDQFLLLSHFHLHQPDMPADRIGTGFAFC